MNKKFLFLTKASISKKLKSKWFLGVNIFLFVLIVSLMNIDSIISFFGGEFTEDINIMVMDHTNINSYSLFENSIKEKDSDLAKKIHLSKTEESYSKVVKEIENRIVIVLEEDATNYMNAKIVSNRKIDSMTYQYITTSLQEVKYQYALLNSSIDRTELAKISTPLEIERVILSKDKKDADENFETVMGAVFPTLILPFFMLIVFLVQMIGAEIYEEKSTRSMEIIISNVPAKTHFLSKIVASNCFVFVQGLILLCDSGVALLIKRMMGGTATTEFTKGISTVWTSLATSGFTEKLVYIVPISLGLLLLSFLTYSITAGLLASLTVNMEDYQQIQTPVMLILVVAYYLAIMSSMFHGSTFIRVLSYLPYLSCLLSPSLLVLGQITIFDSILSILLLLLFNYFLMKKGLKLYKSGILNYSNEKIWVKVKKMLKNETTKKYEQ